jgi:hypothetical protein
MEMKNPEIQQNPENNQGDIKRQAAEKIERLSGSIIRVADLDQAMVRLWEIKDAVELSRLSLEIALDNTIRFSMKIGKDLKTAYRADFSIGLSGLAPDVRSQDSEAFLTALYLLEVTRGKSGAIPPWVLRRLEKAAMAGTTDYDEEEGLYSDDRIVEFSSDRESRDPSGAEQEENQSDEEQKDLLAAK